MAHPLKNNPARVELLTAMNESSDNGAKVWDEQPKQRNSTKNALLQSGFVKISHNKAAITQEGRAALTSLTLDEMTAPKTEAAPAEAKPAANGKSNGKGNGKTSAKPASNKAPTKAEKAAPANKAVEAAQAPAEAAPEAAPVDSPYALLNSAVVDFSLSIRRQMTEKYGEPSILNLGGTAHEVWSTAEGRAFCLKRKAEPAQRGDLGEITITFKLVEVRIGE